MRQAFAGNAVPAVLFGCTAFIWFFSEVRQALRRRSDATNSDLYSLMVVRLSIAVGVALAILAQRVSTTGFLFSPVVFGVSVLLLWAGIGLRWWCFHTLGRYFTFSVMTSADQPVITSGPYGLLRHPSYAGILLALSGVSLTFGNWLSVAVLLACAAVGLINRIRVEERALSATLGPAYTNYANSRKRIIPFVW